MRFHRHTLAFGCFAFFGMSSTIAQSGNAIRRQFDVPTQNLKYALRSVTRVAGLELLARTEDLEGKRSPELHAQMSVQEALDSLLVGTDLKAEISGATVYIRERSQGAASGQAPDSSADNAITVTGTRIRGAKPTSPIILATRQRIEDLGYNDLGSFARSIPQNFAGGQNPGVVSSSQPGSENFGSSSTLNLRGLGPDATLTLLNGNRLAYDATNQGIDIASIPLQAIDRVEVVADGASALYGSDAVGGVANIILRPDYDGLATSARYGGATDGGDVQQQYDVVAGRRWSSGGLMLAGDFNRSTAITAGQRSYTSGMQDGFSLLRAQQQYSGIVTLHQTLSPAIVFDLDGHFDHHVSRLVAPFSTEQDVHASGFISTPVIISYSVSPKLKAHIGGDWLVSIRGTVADSDSKARARVFSNDIELFHNKIRYDNRLGTGEISAEGPLFHLPGGSARMALGAGARLITIDASINQIFPSFQSPLVAYSDRQTVFFGYGEIALPLIGEANAQSWARELQLSAAMRYEHYSRVDGIVTPKVGIRYEPIAGLVLTGSWGNSFKAPTLSQENAVYGAYLTPGSGYFPEPADGRDVILVSGGSHSLKPERANAWTASVTLQPAAIEGLRIDLSHFDVRYRDRVVSPIVDVGSAFTPGLYDNLVLRDPTPEQINAAIEPAPLGLTNQTDHNYDPENVGSIIYNGFQNASRQHIDGIDLAASYSRKIGADIIRVQGDASYLRSNQKLSADQPTISLAGTIFNPPHWRSRLSFDWLHGAVNLSAAVNYIGGLTDDRTPPASSVGDFKTVDLTARVKTTENGILGGISLSASIQNLLNTRPPLIRHSGDNDLTYDATNYSSIGRLIGLTITKVW